MNKRLMYIESESQAIDGRGRIGWVERLSSCQVYRYDGRALRMATRGVYNCFDAGSGERHMIVEPRADGCDKLHGGFVDVDEDAREEYWLRVRNRPDCVALVFFLAEARGMKGRGKASAARSR